MHRDLIRDGDVIAGAVTAALGVYITVTASRWEIMGPEGPGPGFFPTAYGVGLIVLSLLLIASRFRASAPRGPQERFDWPGLVRAMTAWAAFAICAALMSVLGFYISFALMTFFLVLFVFRRTLPGALATSVLAALGFYLVFGLALDVSMPAGFMGF